MSYSDVITDGLQQATSTTERLVLNALYNIKYHEKNQSLVLNKEEMPEALRILGEYTVKMHHVSETETPHALLKAELTLHTPDMNVWFVLNFSTQIY